MKKISENKPAASLLLKITLIACMTAGILTLSHPLSYAVQIDPDPDSMLDAAVQGFLIEIGSGDKSRITEEEIEIIDKIERAFGDEAWKNASYEKIEGTPPICGEVYLSNPTNEEISLQEYEQMLQDHVEKICREHAFNPLLLSLKGTELFSLTPSETVERNIIIQEISSTSPVRIETRSSVPFQYYRLSFYGMKESGDFDIGQIRIVFIQKDGNWIYNHIYCDSADVFEEDI